MLIQPMGRAKPPSKCRPDSSYVETPKIATCKLDPIAAREQGVRGEQAWC